MVLTSALEESPKSTEEAWEDMACPGALGSGSPGGPEAKSGDLIYSSAKKGLPFKALQSLLHFNKEGRGDKSLNRH